MRRFSGSLTARYVDAANARVRSLRWWAASPISTAPWAPLVRDGAYYTLATYPTRVGRACIDGSLSACRAALALVPGADTLRAWFDGEERRARAIDRALAASPRVDAVRHSLVADIEACRQSGADSACHALLQRVGVPSPTSDHSRREFLRLALAHGAPGTFARLIATDSADVGPRLATAAQLPLDSLVAMWRSRMLEGRPPAPMPSAPEVTLCVVIGTALVAVAAGRRP